MIIVEDMELNDEELAEQYFIQFGVKFCKRTIQNYLKILGRTTSTLFINIEPLFVNMKLESKVNESIDSMPSMLNQIKNKLQSGKLVLKAERRLDK